MDDRSCPRCRRPVLRLQASGPPGSASHRVGPAIAYPCQCWLVRVRPDTPAEAVTEDPPDVDAFWDRVAAAAGAL